jgi:chorismate lyase
LKHHSSSHWFLPAHTFRHRIDPNVQSWLIDEGSLTKRLKLFCPDQFSVVVLGMQWVKPERSEAQLLKIPLSQKVLLREVYLKCADIHCVYARSVIPLGTLQGKHRRLKYLGDRPLGEYLFASPDLHRETIEWTQQSAVSPLFQTSELQSDHSDHLVWGRRSLFKIDKSPLLVSEFFLPHLLHCAI